MIDQFLEYGPFTEQELDSKLESVMFNIQKI